MSMRVPFHVTPVLVIATGTIGLVVSACGEPLGGPDVGPPALLEIVAGNLQTDTVGQELPEALVVRVADSAGRAVRSQIVNFRATAGGVLLGA
ncbi:MAG TPA: hypothetical protein VJL31_14255 [Gemmatimonadales bacterium]|nr:hypothetical protein [Gemmatimonadales bacterium]